MKVDGVTIYQCKYYKVYCAMWEGGKCTIPPNLFNRGMCLGYVQRVREQIKRDETTEDAVATTPKTTKTPAKSSLAVQVGGAHYKNFAIQPIEFIHRNKLSFSQGAVIKYVCRYDLKGSPLKDLEKAKHFIDMLIEMDGLREAPSTPC